MARKPKQTPEELESIAFKYYLAGWFFLPFIWLVSRWYFRQFDDSFLTAPTKRYLRWGLIQFFIVFSLMLAWAITFLVWRPAMGPSGDDLAVVTPKGHV
jgi:hypothetical protein